MLNFKLHLKCLAVFSLIMVLSACSRDTLDDIPLFEQYIKENINKSSDDPYISSTVKPGEPMYEYLYKFQQGRGYLSMIEPLIEQGNTDAMVFKGRIYAKYIEGRGETIALLGRAMAAGDPFAALALSDGGEECRDFGKSSISTQLANAIGEQLPENIETCSAENWFKAQDGFKKLAEQGDLAAQYYLLRRQRIDNPDNSREAHEFYIKEIIRFAEGYYYRPLMDYVDDIWEINREEKKYQVEVLINNLLITAANNNYYPSINKFLRHNHKNINKDHHFIKKGIFLGSPYPIKWLLNSNYLKKISLTEDERYFYSKLYEELTLGKHSTDDFKLSDKRSTKVQAEVTKTIENMKPMVYIDGFTRQHDWVDK